MTNGKRGDLGDGEYARTYGWWLGGDTAWEVPCPWWRPPAIDYVAQHLPVGAEVFEWGAGGSTLWLAERCGHLTSLELDVEWHAQVRNRLQVAGQLPGQHVTLLHFGPRTLDREQWQMYADYILTLPDEFCDLVVVDGRCRARCVGNALPKVKVGGMLLLDNSERAEYAVACDLLRNWSKFEVGDEGWLTTIWMRPYTSLLPFPVQSVELPIAEA